MLFACLGWFHPLEYLLGGPAFDEDEVGGDEEDRVDALVHVFPVYEP